MTKKRFYRLTTGPLAGRTLCPGARDYPQVTRAPQTAGGAEGAHLCVAVPVASSDASADDQAADGALVHIYEATDVIDEITLEIVLCKYLGTCPRVAPLHPHPKAA